MDSEYLNNLSLPKEKALALYPGMPNYDYAGS